MAEQEIRYDVSGTDSVTTAIVDLLNSYPGLKPEEAITFSTLSANSGRAMFPATGAIIQREERDILGYVTQVCAYPFHVVYRAAGLNADRRKAVKEWLDTLGRWLAKETVTIGADDYTLANYPALADGRKFRTITASTPAYLDGASENGAEDWAVLITASYINTFKR